MSYRRRVYGNKKTLIPAFFSTRILLADVKFNHDGKALSVWLKSVSEPDIPLKIRMGLHISGNGHNSLAE